MAGLSRSKAASSAEATWYMHKLRVKSAQGMILLLMCQMDVHASQHFKLLAIKTSSVSCHIPTLYHMCILTHFQKCLNRVNT